ncbi:CPBP family intramembrane metalloprotease [Nocardioides sp. ChNu-153]|uniref:CPBP family glutamic-type intramembrane protease n=1 Tax=unclassified Nocardioides TaxID=2615069 RepID=UPI0024072726|nr:MULTISPECIES: CPBP family glutamic-type intramembrane protease [unclassified Nocardioides]MDF9714969.1 CPBP family intramembrane metalloprotease [Nocardioides sp. ChNu-99]MDN7122434.1 CPBP family intramembrane metalloprotease [Nocardioides sp. ChNu-153]
MTADRMRTTAIATVVAGAVVLAMMLRTEPGSTAFYVVTVLLAAVWAGGALLAGPVRLGRVGPPPGRPPVVGPFLLGLVLVGVFVLGALVVREIGPLDEAIRRVMSFTGGEVTIGILLITMAAGVAEEMFFRGVLFDVVERHPVVVTTVVYAVATAATGNVMLAFAALLLGVVTALQRQATHGILAGAITHVTWSVGMLFALPPLFPPL